MIITKDKFLKNSASSIKALKNNGFILIKNCIKKKDLKELNETILSIFNKYKEIDLKKIKDIDDEKFHNELTMLRKNSSKKFALFFDSIQTSSSNFRFWNSNKILKIVEKISKNKFTSLSTTDLAVRFDSPIDKKNALSWHQDSAYFRQNNKGENGINCWTPIINCNLNMGPLEILEKSHNLKMVDVKKKRKKNFGSLERKIDTKLIQNFKLKKFKMKIGDVLFMNMDMVHRSGTNCSKKFRISALCRFHKILSRDFNPGLNIYRYSDKKLNKIVHN